MRILLVEDDESLASGLRLALGRARYTVEHVRDGVAAAAALADNAFDLAILDLGLPRLDGLDVLARLRAGGGVVPVLVLSARDAVRDRIQALDLGADDYLTKPFDVDELLARLRVLERRRSGLPVNQLRRGALQLDLAAMSVRWQSREVEVQHREFMLLRRLLEHPNKVFSRQELEESMYGWGDGLASNAIDVYVHHLRRKISPDVIQTVRGLGYRIGTGDA
ncbi:response regulator transcription factor [uncultured Massilia sp.]|uniref:response regulator transcription factor n=1 Tax=uncultured Massilia sp. TaxID=169973 RepID=UPI0025F0385A|nr:response regulator transcription factor [uncultured Massilia sp.]